MKLAVISQQTLHPDYSEISELQYEYCLKKFKSLGVPTFRHIGSLDPNGEVIDNFSGNFAEDYYYLDNDSSILYLKCKDLLEHDTGLDPRGFKTYYAFKYLIENVDFDVLFTTNCTTYLDVNGIISTVSNFNKKEKLYAGAVSGWEHLKLWFVISAFTFISRDLVKKIVDNKDLYIGYTTEGKSLSNAFVYEDVCIGRVLKHLGEIEYTTLDQPYFTRPPLVHKGNPYVKDIKKCDDCVTYRVEKDYIEGYKKLHSFYTS